MNPTWEAYAPVAPSYEAQVRRLGGLEDVKSSSRSSLAFNAWFDCLETVRISMVHVSKNTIQLSVWVFVEKKPIWLWLTFFNLRFRETNANCFSSIWVFALVFHGQRLTSHVWCAQQCISSSTHMRNIFFKHFEKTWQPFWNLQDILLKCVC